MEAMEMIACVVCTLMINIDILRCPLCGSRQPRRCTTVPAPQTKKIFRKKSGDAKENDVLKNQVQKVNEVKGRKKKRKQTIILAKQSERNQQVKMIVCLFAPCVVICV